MSKLFIAGIHGNETLPVLALSSASKQFIVGNPRAIAENKRFVDCDLNSSFGVSGNLYEQKRAEKILEQIGKDDLVIDFHTFSSVGEPFSIVTKKEMIDEAVKIGLPVVYMKYNEKGGNALIDKVSGISIEVGLHNDPSSFYVTQYIAMGMSKQKAPVFEVFGTIDDTKKYENFKQTMDGFYPVLSGSRAYKHNGFKARKI